MSIELLRISTPYVETQWPRVRPMVKRAMSRADAGDFERTERELFEGLQQLWLAWNGTSIEAIAVTQLTTIGDKKYCVIVACSGSKWRFLQFLYDLEQFAKDEGCKAMRINGRKGWQRVLDDYKVKHVVFDKEL